MVKNRTIVYIDGENLLHRVEESLKEYKLISKKEQILHFALRDLLKACLSDLERDEIRYYSTKIRTSDIKDKNILEYAQIIVDSQRRFKRDLLNQDFVSVKLNVSSVKKLVLFLKKKV